MQDILLIDKPAGITSFDVIRRLHKKFKEQNPSATLRVKMGHAGTLDPMATGLMIVGVGEGTKKLKEYLKLQKVYEAEVMLGVKTTTGDREGEIVEKLGSLEVEKLKKSGIQGIPNVLGGIVGKIVLPVPMYSAVKVKGKPLYKYARDRLRKGYGESKGENIKPPEKEMEVVRLTFGGIKNVEYGIKGGESSSAKAMEGKQESGVIVKFEVEVTSGTYIRSLAEEIGRRLGVPATLWSLRRTKIGKFRIEDAEKLE